NFGYAALSKGAVKYSAVVTGSDQLWSPAGLPTNFYNLQFIPDDICKISYASSFGVSQIPFYQKSRTTAFLNRFQFISMRENQGSAIVKELTGKEVVTVLDPVFMFNADGWNKLIPVKTEFSEPYIFAYFLGRNTKFRDAVKELAEKTGYKIVTLRHLDQYIEEDQYFGDYAPYDIYPAEFLNMLRGASFVCTDSFHGSVFSIIYRKKFMVFNRYDEKSRHSKNSRIDTLCKNLGLEDRRYNGKLCETIIKDINYDIVDEKYQILRNTADKYLDMAFDKVKEEQ
ncbi:MAG: polysaccharide pyruvyl transferase family protein, partial [Mobilitalea sp.]